MKKLLFPIASFVFGIICSVAITGPQTRARVPDKVNEHVIVINEYGATRISSAPTIKDSEANAAMIRLTSNTIQVTEGF